ncbi:aminoglycoside 3'-phosphotransferase/choline kinase family protein [Neorhizobium sp. NCHU2750]|uniref:aminoglycoside phosphotransferase family protein n=1 Tax=Neorhizobium sp. NCHU2750 TaxID=1825976 RepID=UPI000E7323A2|nr:phosphotransferase [Neorhizobium sp. NCHU2750]
MSQLFPMIDDDTDFGKWRRHPSNWHGAVRAIASRHKLSTVDVGPFSTGTNLVVGIDDRIVLKLYPPLYRRQFEVEHRALDQLAGKLRITIPQIVGKGEIDGWAYLLMTRLNGVVGSSVWPGLAEAGKEAVLAEVGNTIAEVQSVAPGPIADVPPRWSDLITRRIAECHAWHAARGLEARFLDDLDTMLVDAGVIVGNGQPAVILTGEYIPENFLLAEINGKWRLAGLFDFGDVIIGPADYDLLGPSAFMAAGKPGRMRHFLMGYGYAISDIDQEWKDRLFTLMLLHRASDLRNVVIDGWQQKIGHLRDLADLIWTLEVD